MSFKQIGLCLMLALFSSCLSDGNETIILEGGVDTDSQGIPDDKYAQTNPIIYDPNVVIPQPAGSVDVIDGVAYATVWMDGIYDTANQQWLRLYGTSDPRQNVWLSVDDTPKAVLAINFADMNSGATPVNDVVMLVDNSTSMDDKADDVAAAIINWCDKLKKNGTDLRVAVVGYGGSTHAITGAINLTTPARVKDYLNEAKGNDRTKHFGGDDANQLMISAWSDDSYENGAFLESGVLALRYADATLNFRNGAARIYVNITDEANHPNGIEDWSVEYLNPEKGNWKASQGVVHTVFCGLPGEWTKPLYEENPTLMSVYTNGSVVYATSKISFDELPMTGTLQNAYALRFGNIAKYIDNRKHAVKVTILTPDGSIRGEHTFDMLFK